MRSAFKAAISVAVVLVLSLTCVCTIPSSDAEMSFQDGKHYGVADTVSYDRFNDVIYGLSGKTIEELITQYFADHVDNYTLDAIDINLNAAITARRDVSIDGDVCTIKDYGSGFLESHLNLVISGKYPNAGTYYANDDEELGDFIARIFGEYGNEQRTTQLHTNLNVYGDIWLTTHVDIPSGQIIDADLEVKLLIKDYEHNTIQVVLETDDENRPESMTISYEEHDVDNMFYTDLEVALTPQNMRIISPNDNWRIDNAVVKEHVEKSIISSELADSLWVTVIAASGDDSGGSSKLPELILEILGSGGRMLDLFDTIKSLTSSDIPDVEFSMVFNAHHIIENIDAYIDRSGHNIAAHTNEYCKLIAPNKTTGEDDNNEPPLYFPSGGYSLDVAQYVKYIPDQMLEPGYKEAATYILIALGLGYDDNDPHIFKPIEVIDLEGHDDERMESDLIRSYVDLQFVPVEKESYNTPEVYEYLAWSGIALTVVIIVLMWRRYI